MTDYHWASKSSGLRVLEDRPEKETSLSVVIAIRDRERAASIPQLYEEYKAQFDAIGHPYEFVFAVEGSGSEVVGDLRQLVDDGEPVTTLVFAKWYGGATVLSAAFDHASGDVIVTLPAYHQIDPQSIPSLFPPLEENDMVVVRRKPRQDGLATRIQVRAFHGILRGLLGFDFNDLGCSVAAFRKEVLDVVDLYGDQHRFLPVLTSHRGFKVKEIEAPQTTQDTFQSHLSVGTYVNRLLDLVAVFFLTKFTRKPLRFFGATGLAALLGGGGITVTLTIQRLLMGVPLKNKPMLLFGILLIVLGILLFSIGLIGEMIIFTNARDVKEYTVEEIID
jgi:glycosyltransferase involved in cell wall biosynthesis